MEGVGVATRDGFWRDRRVLVTGATGIVGSWLVKALLEEEASVVAFVQDANPQTELYRSGDVDRVAVVNGELEDFWALERAINLYETDTVFHLGAQTLVEVAYRFPLPTFEANIRGTYNLLEACRIHRSIVERVIVASSDKAYGEHDDLPYKEDMPSKARHPYDVSKSAADALSLTYFHTYALPVAVARCGNVYGGGDLNWSRLVPGTIRSFLAREAPVIRSDGTYQRDYIYVKDVARAYKELAELLPDERVAGEAFNYGTETPLTVIELVEAIQKQMGCEQLTPDVRNSARAEIRAQYLSAEKARSVSGWRPEYDLESGLRETIDWYRELLAR